MISEMHTGHLHQYFLMKRNLYPIVCSIEGTNYRVIEHQPNYSTRRFFLILFFKN